MVDLSSWDFSHSAKRWLFLCLDAESGLLMCARRVAAGWRGVAIPAED